MAPYRHKITTEFRGQLLEYRRGGVVALDQEEAPEVQKQGSGSKVSPRFQAGETI